MSERDEFNIVPKISEVTQDCSLTINSVQSINKTFDHDVFSQWTKFTVK